MNAKNMTCQEKVFSILTKAGLPSSTLSKEMRDWIALSCSLGMPAQEISVLLVRTLDWQSILESIVDYGLTDDELGELKEEFFAGKLTLKSAVNKAKAKSNQKAKPPVKTAKTPKGHGNGSSD